MTTTVRGAEVADPAGYLRVVDLARHEQLAVAPLPDAIHRKLDPNPRGGTRGGRGLAALPDRLALAVNDRVLVLDRRWRIQSVITHPWMGGIHDVAADPDGLWVTCADNDLVLRVDWDGQPITFWHWRKDRRIRRQLGHGWLPSFDRHIDHRRPGDDGLRLDLGHVNAAVLDGDVLLVGLGLARPPVSLAWHEFRERGLRIARRLGLGAPADGLVRWWRSLPGRAPGPNLLAAMPSQIRPENVDIRPGWSSVVVAVDSPHHHRRPRARVIVRLPGRGVPVHNAVPYEDRIAIADSGAGRVIAVDRRTGDVVRSVELPEELPFPRGLLRLPDGRFVVGTQQPVALTIVDLEAERIDDRVVLPDDRGEASYALVALPDGFEDPAGRLPTTRAGWGITGADASSSAAPARALDPA